MDAFCHLVLVWLIIKVNRLISAPESGPKSLLSTFADRLLLLYSVQHKEPIGSSKRRLAKNSLWNAMNPKIFKAEIGVRVQANFSANDEIKF